MPNKKVLYLSIFLCFFVFSIIISAAGAYLIINNSATNVELLPETGSTIKSRKYVCHTQRSGCVYYGTTGIQNAINDAVTNDVIVIERGIYTNVKLIINKNVGHFFIQGEGDKATSLTGTTTEPVIFVQGNSNVTISNIEAGQTQRYGVLLTSNAQVNLLNTTIYVTSFSAIAATDNSSLTVKHTSIHNSYDRGIHVTHNAKAKIYNTQLFNNLGTAIELNTTGDAEIINNSIYNNKFIGIDAYKANKVQLNGNNIYSNSIHGIRVYEVYNISILSNIIRSNKENGIHLSRNGLNSVGYFGLVGNTIQFNSLHGFNLEGSWAPITNTYKVAIVSNIFRENKLAGVFINQQYQNANIDINIVNNTASGNRNDGYYVGHNGRLLTQFSNNIAYSNYYKGFSFMGPEISQKFRFNHNLAFNNLTGNWNNVQPNSTNLTAAPTFVNYPLDLHLRSNSRGFNEGRPQIYDPDGSRSDIGAYGSTSACYLDPNLPGCR